MKNTGLPRGVHIIPPVFFIVLAGIAMATGAHVEYEPPLLLPLLNTALLSALPFGIAILAALGYARQGARLFLLFGCGMVAIGMGNLIAGWGLARFGQNFSVTVHNCGSLLGGLCHLGGVTLLFIEPSPKDHAKRRNALLLFLGASLACTTALLAVSLFVIIGIIPAFFIQGQGPSLIRQLVLTAAVIVYSSSAALLFILHAQTRMEFLRLFAFGLFLMAIGLAVVRSQSSVGSLLGWTGRASQYAGSIYFFVAMLAGIRESRMHGTTLHEYLGGVFQSRVDDQVRVRTEELMAVNGRLREEVDQRRRVEDELKSICDHSPAMMCILDNERAVMAANRAFTEYTGAAEGSLIGGASACVFGGGEAGADGAGCRLGMRCGECALTRAIDDTLRSGRAHHDMELRLHPDLAAAHGNAWMMGSLVRFPKGRGSRVLLTLMDITDRKRSEEALRRSERSLKIVADFTYDWEMWIDQEGRLAYCSPSCKRVTGYSAEELLQNPALLSAMVAAEDRPAVERHLAEREPGPAHAMEYRIHARDGALRWIGHCCQPVFTDDGSFHGRRASDRDITESKLAEEKLRESEALYKSLIDDSLQGFAIIQDGRLVLCNEALCRMSGYSMEETLACSERSVLDSVHPDSRPHVAEALRQILEEGKALPVEVIRLLRKGGEPGWVEMLGARITYRGAPAVQVFYVDRTEEIKAGAAYHSLLEHASYGMAVIQGGRVVYANAPLSDLCGYSTAELLRMTPGEVAAVVHEDDRERVLRNMSERLAGRKAPPIQLIRFIHKNGGVRWVETQSVRIEHEGAPAVQVSYKDTTAEKAATEQLERANREMRNLAAHLLRIREEERRRIAQDIHDQLGQTLAALKMDMHWVSKRLGGETAPLRDKIKGAIALGEEAIGAVQHIASDLRPRMLDDLGLAPALEWLGADFARRTKIACKVAASLPPGFRGGDAATALYRIAQEALANVGRHSHADHATMRLYASGGAVFLHVEDDGIGMSVERVAAPDSFGLIGMRERAEGLGGSLSIRSEPGFGTILTACVPLSAPGGSA